MFERPDIIKMAGALANHAGSRMSVIARNIANADTPGYKTEDLPDFTQSYEASGPHLRTTREGHISGSAPRAASAPVVVAGSDAPNGNTVSLEDEMVRAADVKRQHDMALSIYQSSQRILRTSLGRGNS